MSQATLKKTKKTPLLKQIAKGLLSSIIGLSLSFLLIELYFQSIYRFGHVLPSFMRESTLQYYDEDGTPRIIPNTTLLQKGYQTGVDFPTRINGLGFRGEEPRTDATKRIVLVGDSVSFGVQVQDEDTFAFSTQAQLRKELRDERLELLNLAVSGTGIRQYVLKVKNQALELQPQLIIVGIYLNDMTDTMTSSVNRWRYDPKSYFNSFALQHLRILVRNYRILLAENQSDKWSWIPAFSGKEYIEDQSAWHGLVRAASQDWGAAWSKENWRVISEGLKEIQSMAGEINAQVLVVLFPVKPQLEVKDPPKDLFAAQTFAQEALASLSIPVLDPLPEMRSDGGDIIFDQCHLTERGHGIITKLLAPKIKEVMKW